MRSKNKTLARFTSLMLSLVMVLTLFPLDAFAILTTPNTGPSVNSSKGGHNGVWDDTFQGFRVTILDHAGEPAFKFMGQCYALDLTVRPIRTWSDLYGVGIKTSEVLTGAATSLSEYRQYIWDAYIDDFAAQFTDGNWKVYLKAGSTNSDGIKKAFRDLKSHPPINWISDDNVTGRNPEIMGIFTNSDDAQSGKPIEMGPDAALRLIFNCCQETDEGRVYLWQLDESACIRSEQGADMMYKARELRNKGASPLDICGELGLQVSVEPIIWNRLGTDDGCFTSAVYGTQADIGWMIDNRYTDLKPNYDKPTWRDNFGGWDMLLFGRLGRKVMNLGFPVTFNYRKAKDGSITTNRWTIEPPQGEYATNTKSDRNRTYYVSNRTVASPTEGYSLNLYSFGYTPSALTETWTYDEINYRTKAGPAPQQDYFRYGPGEGQEYRNQLLDQHGIQPATPTASPMTATPGNAQLSLLVNRPPETPLIATKMRD